MKTAARKSVLSQDEVKAFKQARDRILQHKARLEQEKTQLEREIKQINEELGVPLQVEVPASVGQSAASSGTTQRSSQPLRSASVALPSAPRRGRPPKSQSQKAEGRKANAAVGKTSVSLTAGAPAATPGMRGRRKGGTPSFEGPTPDASLTASIRIVLKDGPKTKDEIHDALVKMGFKFLKDWKITLDSVLFTKAFQRKNGLFWIASKTEKRASAKTAKTPRTTAKKSKAAPAVAPAPAITPAPEPVTA